MNPFLLFVINNVPFFALLKQLDSFFFFFFFNLEISVLIQSAWGQKLLNALVLSDCLR